MKSVNPNNKSIRKLRKFIQKQKEIEFSYIFGSAATGKTGPLSDIDIAFYLNPKLSKKQIFQKQLSLINEVSTIFKTDKIDIVIMNEVPYTLNFEIIKNGKRIFEKRKDPRIDFEASIMSQYLDRRYYDLRHANAVLQKVTKQGLI